jgi:hypothetical protein
MEGKSIMKQTVFGGGIKLESATWRDFWRFINNDPE